MSTSAQHTDPQPPNDRSVVAIAWAVGAVAFAAAAAFIAWLALGQDSSDEPAAGSPVSDAPASEPGGAAQPPTDAGADAESGDSARQTPSPEIAELLVSLQRRDETDTMAVGDVDAPVVMIEYADYRCPYCARFHLEIRPDLQPAVDDGTLRIEFRDLVIFDETSELAAVAGRAAAEQGHLGDFQSAVFALSSQGHAEYGEADLIEIAEEVGVPDLRQFTDDLDNEDLVAAVRADTAEGREIGIQSTPTFLINTQVLQGAYPAEHILTLVEQERQAIEAGR